MIRAARLLPVLTLLLASPAFGAAATRPVEGRTDPAMPSYAPTIVADFEGEHGFLDWFGTGTVGTGRDVRRSGDAFLRLATDGRGEPVAAERELPLPLDATGGSWRLWVRVDDPAALSELWLQTTGDDWDSFVTHRLEPRVLPHDAGVWLQVPAQPAATTVVGDPDRTAIDRIRLRANDDGAGPVEVHVDDLALVPRAKHGAVSITFDDGWAGQADRALPIMQRHGVAGSAFVVPYLIGTDGYMTRRDLEALARAGWDVSGHYHPSLAGREDPELGAILSRVRTYVDAIGGGRGAGLFAYPQGYFEGGMLVPAVARRFDAARTIVQGLETLPPADPMRLRSFTVLPGTRDEELDAALDAVRRDGAWLILVIHQIVPDPAHPTQISPAAFERIVHRVATSGVPVLPVSEVLRDHAPERR